MEDKILLLPLIVPALAAVLITLVPVRLRFVQGAIALAAVLFNLAVTINLFIRQTAVFSVGWAGFGIDFLLKLYHFNSFILCAMGCFGVLIVFYCIGFLPAQKAMSKLFYILLLITLFLADGVVLSDNLIVLLFFWEGLLVTLFTMILIGGSNSFRTAAKAIAITGLTDLCMIAGVIMTVQLAGTSVISEMNIAAGPAASLAFIFLLIGAMGKGGAMPFHVWIPDAAIDAPLPFMAFMPAALEKLLGIYFLTRITVDMFKLSAGSPLCILLMTVGAITIILAVMMALIQKNYKRLLAYHAISQVGYMILGIGTALPAGIIGGIFHMLNNAMYKSCLFLTAGAVEKQTGTTDLEKLGGLAKKMPVTLACFLITAASISGVPPFNGFFSKELIYDAALERNVIFYLAAIAGTFFTAISFLKLGHSAYFNKNNYEKSTVKEANLFILLPMIIIAALCFLFGVRNDIPINKLINPVLVDKVAEHHFEAKMSLVVITSLVLAAALVSHLFQAHKKGDAVKAVDYIHYAPGLAQIYQLAERKFFDTYEIILKLIGFACRLLYAIDRLIDRFYNDLSVNLAGGLGFAIRKVHTGSYRMYLGWSLAGMFLIMMFLLLKG